MVRKVQQYIKSWNMIEQGDRIVVGVSGGADSVALLLVLQELRRELGLQLYAVHVNHGIRKEAAEDAAYVKKLCEALEVSFYLYEANIPAQAKGQGVSEEEMGRLYRYQCFGEVMDQVGAQKLAVAHHMDDQAETMLFHMIRGSKIAGMEGMRPVSALWTKTGESGREFEAGSGLIIRPMLCCRKCELTDWLERRGIIWKEDSTNTDDSYSRNCIRNQVIPVLERVNTKTVEHMAELAEEMTTYREFFQKMVDTYIENHVVMVSGATADGWLGEQNGIRCECNRQHLLQQDKLLGNAVIYEMLVMVCGRRKDLSSVHVHDVYDLLENQSGRKITLPYKMEAVISYEKLIIRKRLEETEEWRQWEKAIYSSGEGLGQLEDGCVLLPDGSQLRVHLYQKHQCTEAEWKRLAKEAQNSKNHYTKFFECDTIKDTLCVRFARPEDYLVISEGGARKKLSRYFIDEKIPENHRKQILVLAAGERVLWVIGRRRCEEYKVTNESQVVLKMSYEGE